MNPHQKNKVDISSLSPQEQAIFRKYGRLPSAKDRFKQDRKYFDSGDYAMSKAGKGDGVDTGAVGSEHPVPENIPHPTNSAASNSQGNVAASAGGAGAGASTPVLNPGSLPVGSPAKESGLQRETSADDAEGAAAAAAGEGSADQVQQSIPIRS